MKSRAAALVVTVLVTGILLSGCAGGSDGESTPDEPASAASESSPEESATEESATEGSFDPAAAALPAGEFCDLVDLEAVAEATGLTAAELEPLKVTKVGDEITPGQGIPPMPATANSCEYGEDAGFLVGIAPDFEEGVNRAMVEEALERAKDEPGKSTVLFQDCEAEETTVVGADGVLETCELKGSDDPEVSARLAGMGADAKFTCLIQVRDDVDPTQLGESLTELCPVLMEDIATG